jgi:hypothetical protein
MMKIHQTTCVLVVLVAGSLVAWGQDPAGQAPAEGQQNAAPPAAFGQDNPPVLVNDNPPISGLDRPSLEPNIQPRSMLLGGVEGSESLDTNIGSDAYPAIHSVTRGLGGLTMQRLWNRYQLAAAYVGGAAYYNLAGLGVEQIHELQAQQSLLWRTGQFTLRDSFSYLPEGSFGYGAYGGSGGFQLGLGGIGEGMGVLGSGFGGHYGILGSEQFGSLGQESRITNVAVADVVENLTPRTSITAAGSYGLVHFDNASVGLINSREVGAQAGYNYTLSPKDQIALTFGYQTFHFPGLVGTDNINTESVQFMYGRRVSGRMDLVLGAGPQWTRIQDPLSGTVSHLSGSGLASLRYKFKRAAAAVSYERFNTSGSGFYAGAESDVVRINLARSFWRRYNANAEIGYSRNKRLETSLLGVDSNSYQYVFAGFAVRRQFGYNWGAFLSYQFNDQILDSTCTVGGLPCGNRISVRHVLTIGLDWHFRPIRID